MRIITTNSVDPLLWDTFINNHPFSSIYHHPFWLNVLENTYGYRPFYHLIINDAGNYQAAVVSALVSSPFTGKRMVSLPFSDMCDPLVETEEQLRALMTAVDKTRKRLHGRFSEFRFFQGVSCLNFKETDNEYCVHRLSLDRPLEQIFRSFHKNCVQRAVKKAAREGVDVIQGHRPYDLKAFYRLHLMTRKKHGVPVQPLRFFRNLWNAFYPQNMATLLLAKFHGKVIASVIILWHNKTGYYKFGASDDAFQKQRANQLLMWEAIQIAHRKGYAMFDFGRTSVANAGLDEYKSRWGTEKIPMAYFQLPPSKKAGMLVETSPIHHHLKKIMTSVPTCINRIGGELFYGHLG